MISAFFWCRVYLTGHFWLAKCLFYGLIRFVTVKTTAFKLKTFPNSQKSKVVVVKQFPNAKIIWNLGFCFFSSVHTAINNEKGNVLEFRCEILVLNQAYRSPWSLSFCDTHNEHSGEFHSHASSLWIVGISQIYSVLQKEKTKRMNIILNIKNKIRYELLRTAWSKQDRKYKLIFVILC